MNLIIGALGTLACVIITIMLSGDIAAYINWPSVMMVLGGTAFATIASFSFDRIKCALKAATLAVKKENTDLTADIDYIIKIANIARRDGLLALEEVSEELTDPFLKKAIMLVVDGSDPELIQSVLETEIDATKARHADIRAVFDAAATYAPSFGMAGTIIGLINMLRDLSEMAALGPAMAVALITTFYGSVLANIIFNPISKRLKTIGTIEYTRKELVVEGMLAIENGENPRVIKEKLSSFLSRAEMDEKNKKAAKAAEDAMSKAEK